MSLSTFLIRSVLILACGSLPLSTQTLTREQWGAPTVKVSHADGKWTIAGKKNRVTLNESNLALSVKMRGLALNEVRGGIVRLAAVQAFL